MITNFETTYKHLAKETLRWKKGEEHWLLWSFLLWLGSLLFALLIQGKRIKKSRKINAWSVFAGKYLAEGKSMKEAAEAWEKRS